VPLLLLVSSVQADNHAINVDEEGVAIHGYDPVAYFTQATPVKGQAQYAYNWSGATWWFADDSNRQAFIANPQRYAPQFGGFCAYAASYGQFADIDPQAWSIVNDRLYLNFNQRVRQIWRPRAAEFIDDAEQLWPTMKSP
jgi:YHS domain-containing protein